MLAQPASCRAPQVSYVHHYYIYLNFYFLYMAIKKSGSLSHPTFQNPFELWTFNFTVQVNIKQMPTLANHDQLFFFVWKWAWKSFSKMLQEQLTSCHPKSLNFCHTTLSINTINLSNIVPNNCSTPRELPWFLPWPLKLGFSCMQYVTYTFHPNDTV